MKITIKYETSEDFDYEVVSVIQDGKIIAELSTASDSPEDNNCSRIGVIQEFENLIKALAPDAEIEHETR